MDVLEKSRIWSRWRSWRGLSWKFGLIRDDSITFCLFFFRLYLRWNMIKKIENLDTLITLEELELYDNQITKIENLHHLVNLQWVTLIKSKHYCFFTLFNVIRYFAELWISVSIGYPLSRASIRSSTCRSSICARTNFRASMASQRWQTWLCWSLGITRSG